MYSKAITSEKARFDAKLSKEQKELFEYAASLGGFRSLTEFVIQSANEKAQNIIKDHNTILASERDKEVFFNALMHPNRPNKRMLEAVKRYKSVTVTK